MRVFHILIPAFAMMASAALADVTDVAGVQSWAYQLQNAEPNLIAANQTFDLIVMDQSHDSGPDGFYTPAQIALIADSGKIPVCYLSIGEAENYRSYWQTDWDTNPPAWLGAENPEWPGNYKVRFWDPDWQAIVFDNIRTIADQGFGGLYLDIVGGYYYWSEENPENPQADRDMAQFVIAIGDSMRAHGGDQQLLIPQNGAYIVVEDDVEGALADQYFQSIDAIGIEDVFFYGARDENNPWNPDAGRLQILADYRQQGITVLSVEYLTDPALIQQYRIAAAEADFIPYTSVRALDILTNGMALSSVPGPGEAGPNLMVTADAQDQTGNNWSFRVHSRDSDRGFVLEVFDLRGRRLAGRSGTLDSGWNDVRLSSDVQPASGLYLYRIHGGDGTSVTGKIVRVF